MQGSKSISQNLAVTKAAKDAGRHTMRRSAVALVLDSDRFEEASVLMIQRAVHEGDPWSGQMGFPGGRQERDDPSAVATAKREMMEEVGLNVDAHSATAKPDSVIGRLSDINTSTRDLGVDLIVSPYVFHVVERPGLALNREVADTVWIPLQFFADFDNRTTHTVFRNDQSVVRPCYQFSDTKIVWGMSLEMIDELLVAMGCDVPLDENPWVR